MCNFPIDTYVTVARIRFALLAENHQVIAKRHLYCGHEAARATAEHQHTLSRMAAINRWREQRFAVLQQAIDGKAEVLKRSVVAAKLDGIRRADQSRQVCRYAAQ